MEYNQFVENWKQGSIEVDINKSKALQVVNSNILPAKYKFANIFWNWVWILSIPGAILLIYFYTWWAGLASLFIITPILSKSSKRSSQQFIIDYALENKEFYEYACLEKILTVRHKS